MKKPKLEDIKILPKVCDIADRVESAEADLVKTKVFLRANYSQAHDIVNEAKEFLEVILLDPNKTKLTGLDIQIMAKLAKRISHLVDPLMVVGILKSERDSRQEET